MVAAEPSAPSSYLEQFLQRRERFPIADLTSSPALDNNSDTGINDDRQRGEAIVPTGRLSFSKDGGHELSRDLEVPAFDDHDGCSNAPVARRIGILPAPRSPPKRPAAPIPRLHSAETSQSSTSTSADPGTDRGVVDGYARRNGAEHVKMHNETVGDIPENHDISREENGQRDNAVVGAQRRGDRFNGATAGIGSNALRVRRQQPKTREQAVVVIAKQAAANGCSQKVNRSHATSNDRGRSWDRDNGGVIMSTRESSALFWEESESLEAMSTIGHDFAEPRSGGSGRESERATRFSDAVRGGQSSRIFSSMAIGFPHRGRATSGRRSEGTGNTRRNNSQWNSARQRRGHSEGDGRSTSRGRFPRDELGSQSAVSEQVSGAVLADVIRSSDARQHHAHARSSSLGASRTTGVDVQIGNGQVHQQSRSGTSVITSSKLASSSRKWTTGIDRGAGPRKGCLTKSADDRGHLSTGTAGGGGSVRKGGKARVAPALPELSLGKALRTMGGIVAGEGGKVSAVGKHITSLEGVPGGVASRATHLYASNNCLTSLQGLESFSGATSASLAHNLVRRTADLRPLAYLPRAETVSLEGNPVCSTANYRAHVVSLLGSSCLSVLDRREVSQAEKTDAPAIVAAERAAVDRIARERCRCILLEHMSSLFRSLAEAREALLSCGGPQGAHAEERRRRNVVGGNSQSTAIRPVGVACSTGRRDEFGRSVWRQRSMAGMPIHQMLIILRVETWPAFDRSELEEMEQLILEEAAEIFAEVMAARRAKGQGTQELAEGASATLDSPSTRMWTQVLEERETEVFRQAPAQVGRYLQDLAAHTGSSDDQWAFVAPTRRQRPVPNSPKATAPTRTELGDGNILPPQSVIGTRITVRRSRDDLDLGRETTIAAAETARNDGVQVESGRGLPGESYRSDQTGQSLQPNEKPGLDQLRRPGRPACILSERDRERQEQITCQFQRMPENPQRPSSEFFQSSVERGEQPVYNRSSDEPDRPLRPCSEPMKLGGSDAEIFELGTSHVTMASAGRFLLARVEESEAQCFDPPPVGSISTGVGEKSCTHSAMNEPPAACKADGEAEAMESFGAARPITPSNQHNRTNSVEKSAMKPYTHARSTRPVSPDELSDRKSTAAIHKTAQRGRMEAEVLQAERGGTATQFSPSMTSSRKSEQRAVVFPTRSRPWRSPAGVKNVFDNTTETETPAQAVPFTALSHEECGRDTAECPIRPLSSTGYSTPLTFHAACATATLSNNGRPMPESENKQRWPFGSSSSSSSNHNDVNMPVVVDTNVTPSTMVTTQDGDGDHGDCGWIESGGWAEKRKGRHFTRHAKMKITLNHAPGWCSPSSDDALSDTEFTRHLLQEAARVKRLLAKMETSDAKGEAEGDLDGLGSDDPQGVIASLGLVELKPLAPKLADALESSAGLGAEGLMLGNDAGGGNVFQASASGASEPRTTRALRDQVAALGKEVAQRAEGCAEARKLNTALRRQVEMARRARARNLDAVDAACRKLIAKAGSELQVLQESRRVAREAERYHATLARLQDRVNSTLFETRKIVSGSEEIARQLRCEMEEVAGELRYRKRVAEEGLTGWEQAGDRDPALRARRRTYDCELLLEHHHDLPRAPSNSVISHNTHIVETSARCHFNGQGVHSRRHANLAAAWQAFCSRIERQRRARAWFVAAQHRRDAQITYAAFFALAHGSRSRAAAAAATAARCRTGLVAWKRTTTLARAMRLFHGRRLREVGLRALDRWRQSIFVSLLGQREEGASLRFGGGRSRLCEWDDGISREREKTEDLECRVELFKKHRAKRVVFRAWREVTVASGRVGQWTTCGGMARCGRGRWRSSGQDRSGSRRRAARFGRGGYKNADEGVFAVRRREGARLRTAEALARRRRFETQARTALRWWRRCCQCNALSRTARQRRALKTWRRRVKESRLMYEATAEARGRYLFSLGKRVIGAWSLVASTRAHRRAAAASIVAVFTTFLVRRACGQWRSQAAAETLEADKSAVALEHCYDRCLRGHLRAWSEVVRRRRVLQRGVGLLVKGSETAEKALSFRRWRRRAAQIRENTLRRCRIAAWTAATSRRRRRDALAQTFTGWSSLIHRRAVVRSLFRRAAARKRRFLLAGAFRAISLSTLRNTSSASFVQMTESIPDVKSAEPASALVSTGGDATSDCRGVQATERAKAIEEAARNKATIEGKVGTLRVSLAQARARALERREQARRIAAEAECAEREQTRCTERLCRRRQRQRRALDEQPESIRSAVSLPRAVASSSGGDAVGGEKNSKDAGDPCRADRVDGRRREETANIDQGQMKVTFSTENGEDDEALDAEETSGSPLLMSLGVKLSDLSEREGELFGKLRAETLEMRQRAKAAEVAQRDARSKADRLAAVANEALESVLAESKRLKVEAEKREAHRVQLDSEAERAVAQASALSDRLAGAEQDLGFEIARNAERLHTCDGDNTRLRANAATSKKRLAAAEDALRQKDLELQALRAQAAKEEVLRVNVTGKKAGARGGRNGQGRAAGTSNASTTDDLEYIVFAAAADAHTSAERCSQAAVDRRAAAGTALAEALHAVAEEDAGAKEAETRVAKYKTLSGDDRGTGPMSEAQWLVRQSTADEERALSGLAMRGIEAQLRRSADFTLRASLDYRPLGNPRSLVQQLAQGHEESTHGAAAPMKSFSPNTSDSNARDHRLRSGMIDDDAVRRIDSGKGSLNRSNPDKQTAPEGDAGGERRPASSRGGYAEVGSKALESNGSNAASDAEDGETESTAETTERHDDVARVATPPTVEGLFELRQEIADLEGKILGRLGGGNKRGASSNVGNSDTTLAPAERSDAEGTGCHEKSEEGEESGERGSTSSRLNARGSYEGDQRPAVDSESRPSSRMEAGAAVVAGRKTKRRQPSLAGNSSHGRRCARSSAKKAHASTRTMSNHPPSSCRPHKPTCSAVRSSNAIVVATSSSRGACSIAKKKKEKKRTGKASSASSSGAGMPSSATRRLNGSHARIPSTPKPARSEAKGDSGGNLTRGVGRDDRSGDGWIGHEAKKDGNANLAGYQNESDRDQEAPTASSPSIDESSRVLRVDRHFDLSGEREHRRSSNKLPPSAVVRSAGVSFSARSLGTSQAVQGAFRESKDFLGVCGSSSASVNSANSAAAEKSSAGAWRKSLLGLATTRAAASTKKLLSLAGKAERHAHPREDADEGAPGWSGLSSVSDSCGKIGPEEIVGVGVGDRRDG